MLMTLLDIMKGQKESYDHLKLLWIAVNHLHK